MPTCGHIGDRSLFNLGLVLLGIHLTVTSFARGLREGLLDFD